jgi:UDP-N-acetylglucosamine transferase subunit ALG13
MAPPGERSIRTFVLGRRAVIFVTIGTMFPFDRLIRAMDEIAPAFPGEEFTAQIGNGEYRPQNMSYSAMLSVQAFATNVHNSRLIVAHAGMGSVIAALGAQKPIVVLPRRPEVGEVTTNHQVATTSWLTHKKGVYVALHETELRRNLEKALTGDEAVDALSPYAQPELIERLRAFICQ